MALQQTKADKEKARKAYKHEWKRRNRGLGPGGNATPGSVKVASCQASSLDRYMANRNRSYKHPGYEAWRLGHSTEMR